MPKPHYWDPRPGSPWKVHPWPPVTDSVCLSILHRKAGMAKVLTSRGCLRLGGDNGCATLSAVADERWVDAS